MQKKITSYLFSVLVLLSLLVGVIGCSAQGADLLPAKERLQVATTTSLYDTGLWGYLEPMFEEKHDVELDVLYAGTGIALEYGRRGDVDVITVHAKSREQKFIAEGYGVKRVPFAYNYFLVVGPSADPAGIKGMSPEDALRKLEQTSAGVFISRGDDSGTHSKEKSLWEGAGLKYDAIRGAKEWYIEAGRGMGPTLLMASEKQAYTLVDMGTFLAFKGKVDLVPIVDKGSMLLNVYSAIAVDPDKNPKVSYEMANNLIDFLTSPEIQGLIGDYGTKQYGMRLFTPCAGAEPQL